MIDVGSAYFCCDECPISEDVERRYRNADEVYPCTRSEPQRRSVQCTSKKYCYPWSD